MRVGLVYYKDLLAGKIKEIDGEYIFKYDDKYVEKNNPPISLLLPVTKEEYHSNILFPFFDNLIPEGWLLRLAVKKWGIPVNDRMGLLLKSCEDTIGAVKVVSGDSDD